MPNVEKVSPEEREKRICELVAIGMPIKQVAETVGICIQHLWRLRQQSTTFEENYTRARELSFEIDADRLKTIVEEIEDVNKARLLSDNIKWLLARRASGLYGDRLEVNMTKTISMTTALLEARRRADIVDAEIVPNESVKEVKTIVNNELTPQNSNDIDIFS